MTGWRKRYFYLEDGLLSYAKNKDKASKGAVSLMNSVVLVHKTDPTRFDIDTGKSEPAINNMLLIQIINKVPAACSIFVLR